MNKNIFYAPKTIQELVKALELKKERKDVFFVAGATDFTVKIRKNGILDYAVIDLTQLDDLKKIVEKDEFIEIGSAVTMTRIEESKIIRSCIKALAEAAGKVGSTQIRNRATIGGNISNAAHCADTITPAFAYGGKVVLLNSKGVYREILMEDFVLGLGSTQIEDDEVLVKICIPKGNNNSYSAFSKVGSRKNVTISKINHAALVVFQDEYVKEASMYFGSLGPKAIKATEMEKHCIGREWNQDLKEELMELGSKFVDKTIPTRQSRHYKRIAIKGVISDVFDNIARQKEVI